LQKKTKYRGSRFTYRDTYDLAAVIKTDSSLLERLSKIEELDGTFERVLNRIEFLQENAESLQVELIGADPALQEKMFEICIQGSFESLDDGDSLTP